VDEYDTDAVTLLSKTTNTWDYSNVCQLHECALTGLALGYQDVQLLSTATTVSAPGGSITKQTKYTYDSPQTGNVTSVKEWKYQSGTAPTFPTVPDKATNITYATIGSANSNNINRPLTDTVCNNSGTDSDCPGGGTKVQQTKTTYDGYGVNGSLALASVTGAADHDDAGFGVGFTTRGNPTQISQWVKGATYLTSAISYDTTGQVIKTLDTNNNPTSYSYADAFFDDNGASPPAVHNGAPKTNAYVTTVTDPTGSTSYKFYYGSGLLASATDYNSVTTFAHYRDPFDRPTETDYPVGWALNQYGVPTGGHTQIDFYSAVGDTAVSPSCVSCSHTQVLLDALGRIGTQNLFNNPAGEATVRSSYDALNRISSVTHAYIGTSDPNNVTEALSYDGLGRTVEERHPDSQFRNNFHGAGVTATGGLSAQQGSATLYGIGFPVLSTDEGGHSRQEWLDGFGRVIELDEPSATTSPCQGSVAISGVEGKVESCTPGCTLRSCCTLVNDAGKVTINVDGFPTTANYGTSSTAQTIASSLAAQLNSANSPVSATLSGSTILISKPVAGTAAAFNLSASATSTITGGASDSFTPTPSGPTLTGGGGGFSSPPIVTLYKYDVLGRLTEVDQGSQTRTYQYDGLGRLTSEITPEAGQITLAYLTASSTLCSGSPSNPCSRTAPAPNQTGAATITTTYTYNTANQLTQKSHSDTTGTEVYTYGTSAANFNLGRVTKMTDPSGSEAYVYDKVGRITQVTKTIGTTAYILKYSYNAGGQLISTTYPSGRIVQYSYDNVGHMCVVAATTPNCTSSTTPYLTLPSSSYDAAGRPLAATYGNGVVATASYSPLTDELVSLGYAKGATTLFGLNYYYQKDPSHCPNGNGVGNSAQIQCVADISSGTGDSGRSLAYTYDSLGRLLTANTSGSTQYPAWGLSWTYDRYGNRSAQTVTAGTGYTSSLTLNPANNRITSPAFTYDSRGNVIAEPTPLSATFTYDGEQCNTGYTGNGGVAAYTCDGNEVRVKKVVTGTNAVTTVSIRSGGNVIAEYDNGAAVASPTREYIFGNSLLAMITGSTGGSGGTIIYQHRDHLSPRLYTDASGNDVGEQGTFPFGESWYSNNTTSSWVFTAYERDKESGNDNALARSYTSGQGRFLSPDPLEGHVGDPQSWNRYAYVENDPINLSDPNGQGFWADLGLAIADAFLIVFLPPAVPVLDAAAAGETAAATTISAQEVFALASGVYAVTDATVNKAKGTSVSHSINGIDGCTGAVCDSSSDGGTMDAEGGGGLASDGGPSGLGGQGGGGGSFHPGEGNDALGMNIFVKSEGCPDCGVIWGRSEGFVEWFVKDQAYTALTLGTFKGVRFLSTLSKVRIAIGPGDAPSYFHVAYKVAGNYLNAVGDFGSMEVSTGAEARSTFMFAWKQFSVPVLHESAVLATEGRSAWTCVGAALYAIGKGWVP
jgi:RHS repeat-associated protein